MIPAQVFTIFGITIVMPAYSEGSRYPMTDEVKLLDQLAASINTYKHQLATCSRIEDDPAQRQNRLRIEKDFEAWLKLFGEW
jgi:hypothetical protein